MFHLRRSAALLALVPLGLLTACTASGADAPDAPAPSAAQSAPEGKDEPRSIDKGQSEASPSDKGASGTEDAAPPTPINGDAWVKALDPLKPRTTGTPMVFTDLRVGEHPSFYRVVVEFSGEGRPGYYQSWPDTPVEQGRGQALGVAGSAFLEFMVNGTSMPIGADLAGLEYTGPDTLAIGPLEVREDGTFEDTTHIVIGMDRAREFQVGFLDDPVRMVIDIKK